MTYFKKDKLEQAVKEGRLEVRSGEIRHQKVVEVRSCINGRISMGQVE